MSAPPHNVSVRLSSELELAAAAHGEPGQGSVLLISGAEEPSSRWPLRLIDNLRKATGSVLTFDQRDMGGSGLAAEDYGLSDLVDDAVAVLDHFDVSSAHVLGRGMGGMIAQLLALGHPTRVRSLTLLSTTAGANESAEQPAEWLVERMAERLFGDPPATPIERVQAILEQREWFAGTRFGFDADIELDAIAREVAASPFPAHHVPGHGRAVVQADPRHAGLAALTAPTLIVHGTEDPVYPPSHAFTLHELIPDSRLELIEGLGHELPEGFVDQLSALVTRLVNTTG